jgi:hypothetical protein
MLMNWLKSNLTPFENTRKKILEGAGKEASHKNASPYRRE